MALHVVRKITLKECVDDIEFSRYAGTGVEIFFSTIEKKAFFIANTSYILLYSLPHDKKVRSTPIKAVKAGLHQQTHKAKQSLYVKAPFGKIDILAMIFFNDQGTEVYRYDAKK